MKKFVFILLLFLLMPVNVYAEVSNDVYLRRDVFEAKMDAFMAEIRLGNEQLRREMDKRFNEVHAEIDARFNEVHAENERLRKEIDTRFNEAHAENEQLHREMGSRFSDLNEKVARLDERTEATKTSVYWGFTILGIILVVAPAFLELVRSLRKPHFTLDEVNQLITKRMEDFNANFMKNIQELSSKGNIEFAGK